MIHSDAVKVSYVVFCQNRGWQDNVACDPEALLTERPNDLLSELRLRHFGWWASVIC